MQVLREESQLSRYAEGTPVYMSRHGDPSAPAKQFNRLLQGKPTSQVLAQSTSRRPRLIRG